MSTRFHKPGNAALQKEMEGTSLFSGLQNISRWFLVDEAHCVKMWY